MIKRLSTVACCLLALSACAGESPLQAPSEGVAHNAVAGSPEPEFWVVDQSNTDGFAYGGALHIFAVPDLMGEAARGSDALGHFINIADTLGLSVRGRVLVVHS